MEPIDRFRSLLRTNAMEMGNVRGIHMKNRIKVLAEFCNITDMKLAYREHRRALMYAETTQRITSGSFRIGGGKRWKWVIQDGNSNRIIER